MLAQRVGGPNVCQVIVCLPVQVSALFGFFRAQEVAEEQK